MFEWSSNDGHVRVIFKLGGQAPQTPRKAAPPQEEVIMMDDVPRLLPLLWGLAPKVQKNHLSCPASNDTFWSHKHVAKL